MPFQHLARLQQYLTLKTTEGRGHQPSLKGLMIEWHQDQANDLMVLKAKRKMNFGVEQAARGESPTPPKDRGKRVEFEALTKTMIQKSAHRSRNDADMEKLMETERGMGHERDLGKARGYVRPKNSVSRHAR
eukprot:NODE_2579_length_1085_cov_4.658301_g2147_i0.p3 GENE.NODE_2579_length_1085_cov_4.658301_g2147_i0~~NODE_2579_length_1085_cov_4.658301_g2147_i0.p3  ORF type:complete len:132 (+),score=1.88 NODE_2579_length_1085_cov_4.658301_g2147_i0:86-481(+)